jgi:hypothetical protein
MSNVNRAVTRARRAVSNRKGSRIGGVPWPGVAHYKAPVAPYTQPPRMMRKVKR